MILLFLVVSVLHVCLDLRTLGLPLLGSAIRIGGAGASTIKRRASLAAQQAQEAKARMQAEMSRIAAVATAASEALRAAREASSAGIDDVDVQMEVELTPTAMGTRASSAAGAGIRAEPVVSEPSVPPALAEATADDVSLVDHRTTGPSSTWADPMGRVEGTNGVGQDTSRAARVAQVHATAGQGGFPALRVQRPASSTLDRDHITVTEGSAVSGFSTPPPDHSSEGSATATGTGTGYHAHEGHCFSSVAYGGHLHSGSASALYGLGADGDWQGEQDRHAVGDNAGSAAHGQPIDYVSYRAVAGSGSRREAMQAASRRQLAALLQPVPPQAAQASPAAAVSHAAPPQADGQLYPLLPSPAHTRSSQASSLDHFTVTEVPSVTLSRTSEHGPTPCTRSEECAELSLHEQRLLEVRYCRD